MTLDQLYTELQYVNHSRDKRMYYAALIEQDQEVLTHLIKLVFKVDDSLSARAAWLLEFVCKRGIFSIIPHLEYFTTHLHKVHVEQAIRPVAKICEYIAEAYYNRSNLAMAYALSRTHRDCIINVCFDYLIKDVKVAPKAYSMRVLFLFGRDYDWIHPELIALLEKDYASQSAAYKARARHIFKALKRKNKL